MCAASVSSVRRNFRRAGRLKKSCRTSTLVPGALPAALTSMILPPLMTICVPSSASVWSSAFTRPLPPEPPARGERETAHAGDAGQGLAAETHRGDGGEVLGFLDFARGMPFQTEQRVVAAHAGAVVGDADETAPARLNLHRDARSLGIERILHQFLHHAGRTLDDFARRDLIGDVLGQQADSVHGPRRET